MTMTPYRKTVIYPGMLALVLAAIPMWITSVLFRNGAQYVFHIIGDPRVYFAFNIPWLIALPVAGAAGAWMSWRNGGRPSQRLIAGLFPHIAMFGSMLFLMLVMAPLATLIGAFMGHGPHLTADDFSVRVWAFRLFILFTPWVFAPALSSLIGALPFLWLSSPAQPHEAPPATPAHA